MASNCHEILDFLYHALGICGEHHHPNLINIGFISAGVYALYHSVRARSREEKFQN